MNDKIPTAKEFLESQNLDGGGYVSEITRLALIKFAKLHVQKALETALDEIPYGGSDEIRYEDVVHILDCYPLENIK